MNWRGKGEGRAGQRRERSGRKGGGEREAGAERGSQREKREGRAYLLDYQILCKMEVKMMMMMMMMLL